jgi:GNAT superfamily N-acetyltransferase
LVNGLPDLQAAKKNQSPFLKIYCMDYNLYLKYKVDLELNINDHYLGSLCDDVFADIMYEPDDTVDDAVDDEEDDDVTYYPEGTKIGFVKWLYYNQALAMVYGVNMNEVPILTFQYNSKALMELDCARISPETIDEIGAATNPNIMILHHFGISAAYRNKGIAEQALKGIIKQMKGKCGYIFISRSRPEQCEEPKATNSLYEVQGVELAGLEKDPEKAQWKINAFFQRCGFRQFKNYENVFVCNVDQVVSERIMVKRPKHRSSYPSFHPVTLQLL